MIDVVKQYEQEKGYEQHPIGMTMQFPVVEQTKVNATLFNSRADWISPGADDEIFAGDGNPNAEGAPQSHWIENPPPNEGKKVILTDTDHYSQRGEALWAWKSFLRGHHPILMDYGIITGMNPPDPSAGSPGVPPYAAFEAVRYAMGDTLRFANRINLLAMEPHGDLSSTGYMLANPNQEYLILQPDETADPFTVALEAGTYSVEWFNISHRETKAGDNRTIEVADRVTFTVPFAGGKPVALYLKRVRDS